MILTLYILLALLSIIVITPYVRMGFIYLGEGRDVEIIGFIAWIISVLWPVGICFLLIGFLCKRVLVPLMSYTSEFLGKIGLTWDEYKLEDRVLKFRKKYEKST